MASILRGTVVAALLAAWSVPAMAQAAEVRPVPAVTQVDPSAKAPTSAPATSFSIDDATQYAAREKQAAGLQDYQGGGYIYIGGGVLTAALIVLLILVLV